MDERPSILALGTFDGMHIGHRALVAKAVQLAKEHRWRAIAYTFYNHPMEIFSGAAPKLLSSAEEKERTLLSMGIDFVDMVVFDRVLADQSPEAFIESLMQTYNVQALVAGFNYTFGKEGRGTAQTLSELANVYGYLPVIIAPVEYHGTNVSSTFIREQLKQGNVALCTRLLSQPYTLSGTVSENRHIGVTLGFPTANITYDPKRLLPKNGVYATIAEFDQRCYAAITNVGTNPTVQGSKISVETHLLHFSGDLYAKHLTVSFIERIRNEIVFPSKKALSEQIQKDVRTAERILHGIGNASSN